ncbi:hypothetical protein N5J44_00050 [Acinetobacter ursingii]|uniref:hypothetical protein n=1 Tax=Acinetobacter ursingii TaxID=108980 RepID=UPI002449D336|nr:hypothetical protein [Acinetobacter ursingii]MDH2017885.1 hypothetical protein [Acinetobacter ursingii]MDH2069954.1 hypothetical protein [Acinetobacter ursingii]
MPNNEVALSDQEKELIQEVQKLMGHQTIEETIQFLARARIREMLSKLVGDEIKRKTQHF